MTDAAASERLFTALELPDDVRAALARLRPPAERGVKPVAPERLHLTLHFIGAGEAEHVARALDRVSGEAFRLTINALGMFSRRGRPAALWAGVEHEPALIALHAALGEALAAAGYDVEARAFRPHITLARLTPRADRDALKSLLARAAIEPLEFEVDEFVLFASETRAGRSVYTPRARFALAGQDRVPDGGAARS